MSGVYRDGQQYVLVETGMPEQHVRIGVGDTLEEAQDSLVSTPIQSTGRDCGEASALRWAHGAGWISSPELDEEA